MPFDPDYGNIEVMPETGDTFIGAEILFPCDGAMTKGCVAALSNKSTTETLIFSKINNKCPQFHLQWPENTVAAMTQLLSPQ